MSMMSVPPSSSHGDVVRKSRDFLLPASGQHASLPEMEGLTLGDSQDEALHSFHRSGYLILRRALPLPVVDAVVAQIASELASSEGTTWDPERTIGVVDLNDHTTFAQGGSRRVVECSPSGTPSHWKKVVSCPSLVRSLDLLLGKDCWEVPLNQEKEPRGSGGGGSGSSYDGVEGSAAPEFVRHWYCPVAFPEEPRPTDVAVARGDGASGGRGDGLRRGGGGSSSGDDATEKRKKKPNRRNRNVNTNATGNRERYRNTRNTRGAGTNKLDSDAADVAVIPADEVSRPVLLRSWREDLQASEDPGNSWQPVSRRRFRGKGWHIDIGPGFPTTNMRTLEGHPYQGLVVLLLLSDCPAGAGGTALVPGSHRWIRDCLVRNGGSMSHDDLNQWVVEEMLKREKDGRARLPARGGGAEEDASVSPGVEGGDGGDEEDDIRSDGGSGGNGGNVDVLGDNVTVIPQVTGRAGDIVLMHPWLIHSGTTNLSHHPRHLANGMARVKQSVFERESCRLLWPLNGGIGETVPE